MLRALFSLAQKNTSGKSLYCAAERKKNCLNVSGEKGDSRISHRGTVYRKKSKGMWMEDGIFVFAGQKSSTMDWGSLINGILKSSKADRILQNNDDEENYRDPNSINILFNQVQASSFFFPWKFQMECGFWLNNRTKMFHRKVSFWFLNAFGIVHRKSSSYLHSHDSVGFQSECFVQSSLNVLWNENT